MADPSTFGVWLKRHRQERGLTQDDLAERVGCATQTIRKIEGGQRRPSYQMADRLAQVLGLAPEERAAWMRTARETLAPEAIAPIADELPPATPVPALPAYFTPFVGREREQAGLAHLLSTPSTRLITLLGPGGIGKTRLAVEVARQLAGFLDGVAFVPLAPIATPQAVVPAIGDALGVGFCGPTDLLAQLLDYLRGKHALLILDNLEHLLDPAGSTVKTIGQLLAQAPHVTLLVTSRERLKLPGEWVFEVDGLAVPPAGACGRVEDYPALALFAEHAQRVQHGFRLTSENEAAIAAICRLVGGMPLGIELAAAWMRLLSPEEIGHELARGLDAEHLSPSTLPARHHSLRSVVDHSWQLLGEPERQALAQLSVFQGGFSRAAADEVAGAGLPVLASLADKSLLRRAAAGRYTLHEIIRQYAAARLRENGAEQTAARDRHSAYYAGWLSERGRMLQGAQQPRALAEISAEIDNIRAAAQWALAHRRLADIRRGAGALQWFYEFRGWFQEGAALYAQAAEALRQIAPADQDGEYRRVLGRILGHFGYLATRIGAFKQAQAALAESFDLLQGIDPAALTQTLMYQGMVAFQVGDYPAARRAFAASRALARPGDSWTIAFCDTWESMVAHGQGALAEAEHLFRSGLAIYRAMGNPRCIVFCVTFCSITLMDLGKHHEAQALLRECLLLCQPTDDRWGMAMALHHLGLVALAQQDVDEAAYLFREALALLRATGNRWEIARALNHLGAALLASGSAAEAGRAYREALATALAAQATPDALQALAGLAAQLGHMGQPAEALALAARVLADPASRTETRAQAARLRAALIPALAPDEAATTEGYVQGLPLASVAELVVPFRALAA